MEFIYDTTVHKGLSGVTMATNFGTKIAINAYKCISMRDSENVITYNRGFSWSTNPKKTFLIAMSKGRCRGNQILAKIGKTITKMAITLVVSDISMQSLVLRKVRAIGEFTCDTAVHKGQSGVTMATNFGTKIAINAY